LPAVALLALKGPLGPRALPAAPRSWLRASARAAWGALSRRAALTRRAGRPAFGLEDRVATALEWAERPDRTALVDALVADATARVERLEPRTSCAVSCRARHASCRCRSRSRSY